MTPYEAAQESAIVRHRMVEYRRNTVLALHVAGHSASEIASKLGMSLRTIQKDLSELRDVRVDIQQLLEDSPVNAEDLHVRLTQMFDADIADIYKADGSLKPITEWPRIWRSMLSGVDVKELFERSKDGGNSSWDKIGELVKVKFADPLKVIELLAALKAVDANAHPGEELSDSMEHLASSIDAAIAEGRKRAAARALPQTT